MKKLLIAIPFLLLAAACNKQPVQVPPAQNQPVQNQQEQTSEPAQVQPPVQATSTINTYNWKTYTNQQYGFVLKYPPTWIFCDTKDQTCNGSKSQNDPWVNDIFIFCDNVVPPGTLNGQKTVAYCNNPHLTIMIGKSSQPSPALPIIKANYNKQRDISIGGVKGTEFFMTTQDSKVYMVSNGLYTYQITSHQFPDDPHLAEIISNFKFTK